MRLATALILTGMATVPAQAQERYQSATHIGRVDSIWSAKLDEQRPYLVYTPPSYGNADLTPARYPVLYLLDGDAHFHSVTGLIQILGTGVNGTFVVPEMIVVAIPNTGGNRTRDLTPTRANTAPDGSVQEGFSESGGGAAFLDFIKSELIPHIDAEYRTMPYRVFVGHSLGGITTLDALYTMPETFDAYVAIDPSLWWDSRVLLQKARGYFESARLENKALYVAQANTITPGDTARNVHFESITAFDAIMRNFDKSGIRYGYRYYPEDSHGSVPMIAEYDALRFIFDGFALPVLQALKEPDLVDEHYRRISQKFGVAFEPSEAMMRTLISFSLQVEPANAITFAEMRIARYPQSPKAYEAMADILAGRGEPERARSFYEQAIAHGGDETALRASIARLGS